MKRINDLIKNAKKIAPDRRVTRERCKQLMGNHQEGMWARYTVRYLKSSDST